MGFGRESNYGALGFKATRGTRATGFSPLIQYRTSSRSSIETSFNGADFEQTNRFPSQYHSSCHRAFVRRYVRPYECIRTFASGTFSALVQSKPILPQPHPLPCSLPSSARLYRSLMERVHIRRKRLVYSSASYRYVNGESRSC